MSPNNARQYQVEHHTAYHYSEPVMLSHQLLHLTPRTLTRQTTQLHDIAFVPAPTLRREFIDPFGNPTTEIAIESAHHNLYIFARTRVRLSELDKIESSKTPDWESVREALNYRAGWHPEAEILEATQYLFESPHSRVKRDLRAYAGDCFTPGRPILDAATALMEKIHKEFKYVSATTSVGTPVMKFFQEKCGVCQDFAHLMISCLRSTGLAARYVSGYLLTRPPPGRPRRIGADASHAWVSLFVPQMGWIDLDPTNNVLPSLEHITIGWGRDFSDVTPLRGIINGGGIQKLEVKVTVELMPNDEIVALS